MMINNKTFSFAIILKYMVQFWWSQANSAAVYAWMLCKRHLSKYVWNAHTCAHIIIIQDTRTQVCRWLELARVNGLNAIPAGLSAFHVVRNVNSNKCIRGALNVGLNIRFQNAGRTEYAIEWPNNAPYHRWAGVRCARVYVCATSSLCGKLLITLAHYIFNFCLMKNTWPHTHVIPAEQLHGWVALDVYAR